MHSTEMHSLHELDMNYFRWAVGDGVGEKKLEGWFKCHVDRESKHHYYKISHH